MDGPLNHCELYSLAERDEQYQRLWLEDGIQEISQRVLGTRKWLQLRSAITVLSRFGYFATNVLLDYPTPGQEFCNAEMITCNLTQRLLMIILNNELKLPTEVPKPIVKLVRDVHLITFYLFGDFYELGKRVTGVSYVRVDPDNGAANLSGLDVINRLVGCLSMMKLILDIPKQQEQLRMLENDAADDVSTHTDLKETSKTHADSSMLCQLCSSQRNQPTSTLCGHIFCWSCIHNWLKERNECPICRMPTEPSRLIHLLNFK